MGTFFNLIPGCERALKVQHLGRPIVRLLPVKPDAPYGAFGCPGIEGSEEACYGGRREVMKGGEGALRDFCDAVDASIPDLLVFCLGAALAMLFFLPELLLGSKELGTHRMHLAVSTKGRRSPQIPRFFGDAFVHGPSTARETNPPKSPPFNGQRCQRHV